MIEKLSSNILINDKIKSVYNFNEYSIQDLLSKFFEKINESVDLSNKALDFLTYLKEEGLPKEVIKELEIMYLDGRLTNLIDEFTGNVTQSINEINNKIEELAYSLSQIIIDGGNY